MAYSIDRKMVVVGKIYLKTSLPIRLSTSMTNRESGLIDKLMAELHENVRQQVKKPKWTTLMLVDSQAVKNACNASKETKGFCFYKSTNGIKRHLAVDTLGFPLFTHCTKANITDDAGLVEMFSQHIDYFKEKPATLPTILLDSGYHPEYLTQPLEKVYSDMMTKIRFELSPKPSRKS